MPVDTARLQSYDTGPLEQLDRQTGDAENLTRMQRQARGAQRSAREPVGKAAAHAWSFGRTGISWLA